VCNSLKKCLKNVPFHEINTNTVWWQKSAFWLVPKWTLIVVFGLADMVVTYSLFSSAIYESNKSLRNRRMGKVSAKVVGDLLVTDAAQFPLAELTSIQPSWE